MQMNMLLWAQLNWRGTDRKLAIGEGWAGRKPACSTPVPDPAAAGCRGAGEADAGCQKVSRLAQVVG